MKRRTLLQYLAASGALAGAPQGFAFQALGPTVEVDNPLKAYPAREWEKTYLDQYRYDASFAWVCSPNCTHACRMRAFVRNGVMLRSEQNYDSHKVKDLYGNSATAAWNPRGCSNGFTFQRRVYGPNRLRYPIVRRGWKQWADDGFPELTAENHAKYKFDARGQDDFVRVTFDEAHTYVAKGLVHIAAKYSGDEGRQRLLAQGYGEEMLHHWEGAGTRTIKCRGGMGLLGVMGKYGMYRFCNALAYLDQHVRKVAPADAKAGRLWSNYTWHGDQAPGHPFVHGLQTSDCDLSDFRATKFHLHIGKNLIENKRADNHFFTECMERGAKICVIAPEYSPPASKADYWIPIRPNSDAALLLGVTKLMIDRGGYDAAFVKGFTDFPLLVRRDNLRRLRAAELFEGYHPEDMSHGASARLWRFSDDQRRKLGDFVVFDDRSKRFAPVTRDDVGDKLAQKGIDPALEGSWTVTLAGGQRVELITLFSAYKDVHLKDYDLDAVCEMTSAPKDLVLRLADDLATIKPACIHTGEGINHWFHATEVNRATYLPLMLTGNIGRPGAGGHTWAGNYKSALFQGSAETGPGLKGWVAEDPFDVNLDATADGKDIHTHAHTADEEPAYWNYGDKPLVVNTPKYGKRSFTGKTHLPTPTKAIWFTNVNLINNAKWAYEMIKNVDPKIELIVATDIELNASVEYSDVAFPATSWTELQTPEITGSCSNPFLQIWKGGMKPVYEAKDDLRILADQAKKLGELIGDSRFTDYFKFVHDGRPEVYIQRLLDASTTTRGYRYADIMAGRYGEPGAALFLFRTYPRVPFYEQVTESLPFFTPTGRLQAYNDEPEVIEYGENFIVHREGPEATPYLPNVIVSSSPLVRPDDYGIPADHLGASERQIRNLKLPWSKVKATRNPLWEKGFRFFCLTPKTRHATHSQWQVVDWQLIWNNPFGDPHRTDQRSPGVGEHSLSMNPEAARDLGLAEGDYVYVDANPADRPYVGWKPADPFYRVARLMLRLKLNPGYPYDVVMMKHAPWIATERSVKAHETRPDGRAVSEGTSYQAMFRYGSQQSVTRGWLMPMHQLDSLFHKAKGSMSLIFGGEADNHAVNTTPKETLVRITKAESGGLGGKGPWEPARSGFTPRAESLDMQAYLEGRLTTVKRG
ncbi:MAG: molybdopterin-dependent oxidoreductase [Myxococcaceae bacterium]|nr:molybdopterin-dependent oxidoreductase [Myxococcaceae bacterium]